MQLFGVSRFKVFLARLHAAEIGPDRPVPPSLVSYRIPPDKAAHLTAFIDRPEFVQVHAHKKDRFGNAGEPLMELLLPRDRLYAKYCLAVPKKEEQVSRSEFYKFTNCSSLRMLACKSCLCGPCEEYGHDTFCALEELVKDLSTPRIVYINSIMDEKVKKSFLSRIEHLADYLRHDYRSKCCDTSTSSTLCIRCPKKRAPPPAPPLGGLERPRGADRRQWAHVRAPPFKPPPHGRFLAPFLAQPCSPGPPATALSPPQVSRAERRALPPP